ncbi:MAG: hypothetical protein WAN65_11580, partial [Candidatus Sulfotelmatobacter sp.]
MRRNWFRNRLGRKNTNVQRTRTLKRPRVSSRFFAGSMETLEDRRLLVVWNIIGDLASNKNDTLILQQDGSGNYTANLNGITILTAAAASVTQINFNGFTGNDSLIVDSSNGLVAPTGGINYDGGTGFNTLTLRQTAGPTQTSDTYSVGPNVGSGSDVIVGSATQTVFFQNLAPVQDNVTATTSIVNATPSSNAINYTQGPGGGIFGANKTGLVTIDNQESFEFNNKTNLVINSLAGDDTINLNNPTTPAGLTGNITVNGGDPTASDTLIVNGIPGTSDRFQVQPTAVGAGNVFDYSSGAATLAPQVAYTGIEALTIVGQTADGDSLSDLGTMGDDTFEVGFGADPSSGTLTGFAQGASGFAFTPITFAGISGFLGPASAVVDATGGGTAINFTGGNDTVIIDGTAADDTFTLDNSLVVTGVRVDTGSDSHTIVLTAASGTNNGD